MTVADPAGDAPAAGDRDGLPRRGFWRLSEQGPGLLEGPGPSQSPCLQPLTPVRAHLRQAMTSSSYAGNPRFGYQIAFQHLGALPDGGLEGVEPFLDLLLQGDADEDVDRQIDQRRIDQRHIG